MPMLVCFLTCLLCCLGGKQGRWRGRVESTPGDRETYGGGRCCEDQKGSGGTPDHRGIGRGQMSSNIRFEIGGQTMLWSVN